MLLELSNIPRTKLKTALTPSSEEWDVAGSDFEEPGELSSAAAKVLVSILFAARIVTFDLLQPAALPTQKYRVGTEHGAVAAIGPMATPRADTHRRRLRQERHGEGYATRKHEAYDMRIQ